MPSYRRHFVSQSGVGKAAVSDFFVSWSDQTLKPYRNTMKFFVDTANLDQIREAHAMGVLDGVTTNPSLMARENIRGEEACRRHYVEICRIVQGDVSAEVISTDFEGMVREGEALAALDPHIVVKLPCTAEGIRAVRHFAERGIRTNCTLVFSVGQALLAAKAGATYVSPFVGRLDDISEDGVELVAHIDPSHAPYHPVSRCRSRCGDLPALGDQGAAPPSAHGERAGAVPGGLCPGERIAHRADGTEGAGMSRADPRPVACPFRRKDVKNCRRMLRFAPPFRLMCK